METIADRLRDARTSRKLRQGDLADAAGVTAAAISALEKGLTKSPTPETLFPLARRLGVSPEWLITGKGEREAGTSQPVARFETTKGYLRFQVMGEGGAGPGMINADRPEVLQEIDVAEWSVRSALGRTVSPDRVKLLTVRGNSMAPRIKDGDVVFVDIQDTAIMDGGIFVFVMHGQAIVKRLDIRSDGFHIVSLAEPGNPDVIDPDHFDSVHIAGRVLGTIQLRNANEVAYS
ncbi:MAG: putative HTH-type transcriptional regulator [Luteibacter sp.]|nr:MAG: putative HTH-type transcriptional regulator [Luteibacter sp.]